MVGKPNAFVILKVFGLQVTVYVVHFFLEGLDFFQQIAKFNHLAVEFLLLQAASYRNSSTSLVESLWPGL